MSGRRQVGERRRQLGAGRGRRRIGAGNPVDGGDVHRPPEVVVGDVPLVVNCEWSERRSRERQLVLLGDRPDQADDPRVDSAAGDVVQLEVVGEGQVVPVDRRPHRFRQRQRPVDRGRPRTCPPAVRLRPSRLDVPCAWLWVKMPARSPPRDQISRARVAAESAGRRGGCGRPRCRRPRRLPHSLPFQAERPAFAQLLLRHPARRSSTPVARSAASAQTPRLPRP